MCLLGRHHKLPWLKMLIKWTNVKYRSVIPVNDEVVTTIIRSEASSVDVTDGSRIFLAAEIDWAASWCQCIDSPGLHSTFDISSIWRASLIMIWPVCFSRNLLFDRSMIIRTLTSLVRGVHQVSMKYIASYRSVLIGGPLQNYKHWRLVIMCF